MSKIPEDESFPIDILQLGYDPHILEGYEDIDESIDEPELPDEKVWDNFTWI